MMLNPNPQSDRALIGVKRKTTSSCTAVLLNMGQSPRVYLVGAASKCKKCDRRDGLGIGYDLVDNNSGKGNNANVHLEAKHSDDTIKSESAMKRNKTQHNNRAPGVRNTALEKRGSELPGRLTMQTTIAILVVIMTLLMRNMPRRNRRRTAALRALQIFPIARP